MEVCQSAYQLSSNFTELLCYERHSAFEFHDTRTNKVFSQDDIIYLRLYQDSSYFLMSSKTLQCVTLCCQEYANFDEVGLDHKDRDSNLVFKRRFGGMDFVYLLESVSRLG